MGIYQENITLLIYKHLQPNIFVYRPLRFFGSGLLVLLSFLPSTAYGWYGKTHKWLSQEAASFLPEEERIFFERYRNVFFQGAVNADRYSVDHHTYFKEENGRRKVVDNSAPIFSETRAMEAIDIIHQARIRGLITEEDKETFAEKSAQAIHAICDMQPAHTTTGEGKVHKEIELEVNMDVLERENFSSPRYQLKFDRKLRDIDPYTATVEVAKLAHYGSRTVLPAEELLRRIPMGEDGTGAFIGSEDWDAEVDRSIKKILQRQVNVSAEVLHWIYRRAFVDPIEIAQTYIDQPETTTLQTDIQKTNQILQTQTDD